MNKKKTFGLIVVSVVATLVLQACGGSSNSNSNNESGDREVFAAASKIPYLRENHKNYSDHGTMNTPAPTHDAAAKSVSWIISATTTDGAVQLGEHIRFMEGQLKEDKNPRAFDTLFVLEGYMKFNGYYSTAVEVDGTTVIVSKVANTNCAYQVIVAHSNVVSGDFFGKGEIMNDHSATADMIVASADCASIRSELLTYIADRKRTGM